MRASFSNLRGAIDAFAQLASSKIEAVHVCVCVCVCVCLCEKCTCLCPCTRTAFDCIRWFVVVFCFFGGAFCSFFYYFSMEVFHVIHAGGWRVQTRLSIQEEPQEAFEQAMECALVCAERRWIHAVV